MKKLLSIGFLLLSCTSETPPDFTLDSGVVCNQIDNLNEKLNECLSKSCYYQVPIDLGIGESEMGISDYSMDFAYEDMGSGDFLVNNDYVEMNTMDYSLTNCDPDLEAVIETCLSIFSSINDCKNGFPKRDQGLDLSAIPSETQDVN